MAGEEDDAATLEGWRPHLTLEPATPPISHTCPDEKKVLALEA